jgi:hypothetical protein
MIGAKPTALELTFEELRVEVDTLVQLVVPVAVSAP